MKVKTGFALFVVLALLLVLVPHTSQAYFYQQGIANTGVYTATVKMSKTSYSAGEPIVISGQVEPYDENRKLQITVMDSSKDILFLKSIAVNSDASFSVTVGDTSEWEKDAYTVLAQYGTSDVKVGKTTFSFGPTMDSPKDDTGRESTVIPSWIKDNAKWWAEGTITDNDFVQGIQYLISQDIMKIPVTAPESDTESTVIPSWIKDNAKWWAEGTIDNSDFVQGLQYLISQGIMKIPKTG